jgi:ABC-2 type transport system permease protein
VTAQGSIYDLGYQGYDGPRLGRLPVAWGLTIATLKSAYGIGRGGRAKITPFTLAGLAVIPAVVAVGISAIVGQMGGVGNAVEDASPIRHSAYWGLTATLTTLFCAAQAPELFGRDQRHGVLPLFFSRAITRFDYALARISGLFLAIFLMAIVPHLLLTVGAVLAATDPATGIGDELPKIPQYLAIAVLGSAVCAGVAAGVSAWTPRRAYATAGIIAAFIIPSVISVVVTELSAADLANIVILLSPSDVLDGANAVIHGVGPDSSAVARADLPDWAFLAAAVGWVVVLVGLILQRYRTIAA